jgi:hypothetical protein
MSTTTASSPCSTGERSSGSDRRSGRGRAGRPWPYAVTMSHPAPPRSSLSTRVVVGLVVLIVVWFLIRIALGMVYSVIRGALFVALFAIVAWVVLVGPPGRRD